MKNDNVPDFAGKWSCTRLYNNHRFLFTSTLTKATDSWVLEQRIDAGIFGGETVQKQTTYNNSVQLTHASSVDTTQSPCAFSINDAEKLSRDLHQTMLTNAFTQPEKYFTTHKY